MSQKSATRPLVQSAANDGFERSSTKEAVSRIEWLNYRRFVNSWSDLALMNGETHYHCNLTNTKLAAAAVTPIAKAIITQDLFICPFSSVILTSWSEVTYTLKKVSHMDLETVFSTCSDWVVAGLGKIQFEPLISMVPERDWIADSLVAVN